MVDAQTDYCAHGIHYNGNSYVGTHTITNLVLNKQTGNAIFFGAAQSGSILNMTNVDIYHNNALTVSCINLDTYRGHANLQQINYTSDASQTVSVIYLNGPASVIFENSAVTNNQQVKSANFLQLINGVYCVF